MFLSPSTASSSKFLPQKPKDGLAIEAGLIFMEGTIMKRAISFAVLAVVSSLAFSTASRADSLAMNDGPVIEKTLKTFDKPFDVKYLNDYQNQKTQPDAADATIPRTEEGVQNIRASISANKSLAGKLEAKGIDIDNVVNAQQAADGSMTFFIK